MKKMFSRHYWILLVLSFSFVGCATAQPILVQSLSPREKNPTFTGKILFVMPPKVIYKDVRNEQEMPGMETRSKETSSELFSFARNIASTQGFKVVTQDDLNEKQKENLELFLSHIANLEILLKPQSKNREQLVTELHQLSNTISADAIVVQILEAKVGLAEQWSPITGTMTAGTNSFDLRSGLVETTTGNIIWQREVFTREFPKKGSLENSLKLLYSDFPTFS